MKIYIAYILLTVSSFTFSQVAFQKSYGDSGNEKGYSITELKDSSYAITGVSTSFSTDKDIIVVKVDSAGIILWTRTLRGEKIDVGRKIMATTDGGMIIVGSTASFGVGRRDIFLIKLDQEGETEWEKTYGGPQNEYAFAVTPTIDGGYIIGGETSSFGVEGSDILIFKTDARGNLQWSSAIGGRNVEYAFDVLEHYDGYLIGFETNTWGMGAKDVGLFKMSKKGEFQWLHTYGGLKEENINGLLTLDDGSIAMTGITSSFGYGNLDGFFLKCNKSGDLEFARTYGDVGSEVFQGITKAVDGYILCGFSNSFNDQLLAEDLLIVKINDKGRTKWSKTYGGIFMDVGLSMIRSTKDEIIVVGETKSFSGRSDSDIYLVKNQPNGSLSTCEQSRVQLIDQNAAFVSNNHDPTVNSVQLEVTTAKFKNTKQLLPDLNICADGETIINEREEQIQTSK
jgi:hypothetical protein